MKILHVTPSMDPATGGPPRVVARMAAALVALGHEVTIASYAAPEQVAAIAEMVRAIPAIDRVRFVYLPNPDRLERLFARRGKVALAALATASDVVHVHGVWDSLLRVAAAVARRQGKPYFVQPDGMLDPWCLQQKALKKRLALALSYRAMLDHAAGLALGNDEEARLIRPLGLRAPVVVTPLNGVILEEIEPLPAPGGFRRLVPALQDHPFAVFLGRLHPKKGLDYLADAFALLAARLAEPHLVVVGHDEGAQADFVARIARARLQARVHLVGPLHGMAKWQAYRDAACFVLPSRQEGFSIAITEALASSLPVVISRPCHFDEVAEWDAGLVVELSAPAVAAGLEVMFADPARRARMSEAARALIAARYTCQRIAERLVEAYQQALARPRTG